MLETRCLYGSWHYCADCARKKGYSFSDFKDKLPIIDHEICKEIGEKLPFFYGNFT